MDDDVWKKYVSTAKLGPRKTVANFVSLLDRTKLLFDTPGKEEGKTGSEFHYWRAYHNLRHLDRLLKQVANQRLASQDAVAAYKDELEFLGNLLKAEAGADPCERLALASSIAVGTGVSALVPSRQSPSVGADDPPSDSGFYPARTLSANLAELRKRKAGQYSSEVRAELFSKTTTSALQADSGRTTSDSFDRSVAYQDKVQEVLTEELTQLTRALKGTIVDAGEVVKEDTRRAKEMSELTDKNYEQLKKESVRLEKHAYKSCDYWIWFSILLVCLSFIGMVLFMRVFSKRAWFFKTQTSQ